MIAREAAVAIALIGAACAAELGDRDAAIELDGVVLEYTATGGTCGHQVPETFVLAYGDVDGAPYVIDHPEATCSGYGTGAEPERYLSCTFDSDVVLVTDLRDLVAVLALADCFATYDVELVR